MSLRSASILLLVIFFIISSCTKHVSGGLPTIAGSWRLNSIARHTASSVDTIHIRQQAGSYFFHEGDLSGKAEYSDNILMMTGSWEAKRPYSVSQDENGNNIDTSYSNIEELSIKLKDPRDNRGIDWYFSRLEFVSINSFIGIIAGADLEYRYEFQRL
jgi:hypothetical protein